jgi:hypothetical protein
MSNNHSLLDSIEPALKQVIVITGTGLPDGPETNPLSMADPTIDVPINGGAVGTNFPVVNNYLQIGLQFRVLKPTKFCGCRLWLPAEEIAVSTQKTVWLWDLKGIAKAADILTPTLVQGWNEVHLQDCDQIVLSPGDYVVSTVFHAAFPRRNFFYQSPIAIGDFAQAILGVFDDSNNQPSGVIPTMTFEFTSYYVDVLLKSTGADVSVNVHEHVEHYPTFKENFNLDGSITDFLVKGTYQDTRVMAYTDKESVNVGETVDIHGSSDSPGNVEIEIIRVGYYGGEGGKVVDTTTVPFTNQTSQETLTAPDSNIATLLVKRCRWNIVYTYNVPVDAITGVYYIRLTCVGGDNDGAQNHASFVVRNDAITGDILVKINTNTFAAYNDYGHFSFYSADPVTFKNNFTPKVSKDRPNWLIHVQRWELCTIYWLERMGYRVSYCTDQDIHEKGEAYLYQFKIHLSSGHDEYWTKKQYDSVFNAVNAGLNIILLGANAAYWVGRYEDNNRTYCVYKESVKGFDPNTILIHDPIEPTCRPLDSLLLKSPTENPNNRYPESRLWGVMYTNNGDNAGFDYRINANQVDTFVLPAGAVYSGLEDPLFEGTGFEDGDILPNCAGYEIDHISNSWMPEIKSGTQFRILNECLNTTDYVLQPGAFEPNWGIGWRSDPEHDGWVWTAPTQNNFPAGCAQKLWRVGQTVYFERPNGAKCFASGHVMTPYCLAPSYMRELFSEGVSKESNAFGRLLQNVITSMNVWGAYGLLEVTEGADLPDLIAEERTPQSFMLRAVSAQKPCVPTEVNTYLSGNGVLRGSCTAINEATEYRWQYSKNGVAFTGDRMTIANTVQWPTLDTGSYHIRVQAINRAGESAYSEASAAVNITLRVQALSKLEAGTRFTPGGLSGQSPGVKIFTIREKRVDGSMLIFDETRQLELDWSVEVVNSYLFVQIVQKECG